MITQCTVCNCQSTGQGNCPRSNCNGFMVYNPSNEKF